MNLDKRGDDLNYQTGKNEEVGDFFDGELDKVAEILEIEKCPNCDEESYIGGKCKSCGLGYGEEVFGQDFERRRQNIEDYSAWKYNLSNALKGHGKHIEMSLYNGEKFIYIDYKNRLNKEKQEILARIKYDGKIFEIFANYSIEEIENYIDGGTTRKLHIELLKHPEVKEDFRNSKILFIYKDKNTKKIQKSNGFLDYKLAEEIIKKILKERFRVYG